MPRNDSPKAWICRKSRLYLKGSGLKFVWFHRKMSTNKNWRLPRRSFLRGLGTVVALPMLEAMSPLTKLLASGAGAASPVSPKRMAFVFVPNGVDMANWTPKTTGADFELPEILSPLDSARKNLLVLSGLAHDKARANGDGAGDHARGAATFLTASQARKTDGANIKIGISVDQVAAAKMGAQTRFASLELGCDRGQRTGNCDSGYSCAYSYNIAWKTESTPMPPEVDPRLAFERLFSGGGVAETAARRAYRKSVLDFVLEDARRLQSNLGATDRRKLDEYLTAVRELEQRIERAEKFSTTLPDYSRPSGIPKQDQEHIRLMYDLMALGFQTDSTRIATFIIAHDGSNRPYPNLGISEGHHNLSHHENKAEKKEKIAKINRYHIEQFAYFIGKLKSIREGEGTLLDSSMIVYGSGIGDGNAHNHDNLPVLLAGGGAGTIKTGRHVRYDRETPMANLYLSLLDRIGAPMERFGDSTGRLKELS